MSVINNEKLGSEREKKGWNNNAVKHVFRYTQVNRAS